MQNFSCNYYTTLVIFRAYRGVSKRDASQLNVSSTYERWFRCLLILQAQQRFYQVLKINPKLHGHSSQHRKWLKVDQLSTNQMS